MTKSELYFANAEEWRIWLHDNHSSSTGVYLIFYRVSSTTQSMRWEEAVKVALCYGWIDSTVKRIDHERRKQAFTPRKPKSMWSKLNKTYIEELIANKLIHKSGALSIQIGKENGSWDTLNDVDDEVISPQLQKAFELNLKAFENYKNFAASYRKGYLYWLYSAKREATQQKRIAEIIRLCLLNQKKREGDR